MTTIHFFAKQMMKAALMFILRQYLSLQFNKSKLPLFLSGFTLFWPLLVLVLTYFQYFTTAVTKFSVQTGEPSLNKLF